jgi:peptide deformylase
VARRRDGLRATAQRVVVFDEDLCSLATDLLDTLRAASAIGITATHIGVLKRLAVIEIADSDGMRTYVNPQIVWASADMIRHEEGSVSMPGVTEEIERHARVRVSYQDLSGVEKVEEADGLLSVCLQHEVDQLDGIFWISRLSRLKRGIMAQLPQEFITIFDASGDVEEIPRYVDIHRCFKRGEAINLCEEALASGPLNTRQLALRVMAAKGLDTGDKVLAKAVAARLIHALRHQCRRGLIDGTEKHLGARVWALPTT